MQKFFLFSHLFLIAFSSSFSMGQIDDTRITDSANQTLRWYQVEVFVFAHNNPNAALDEQWPTELGLSYPANRVVLTQPVSAIEMPDENEQLNLSMSANTSTEAAELLPSNMPAFSLLDSDEHKLNQAASQINSQYDLRPLFHQAWRQPILDRDKALSIVITGGDAYDQHFELEGSVKISLERYLHVDTDLWLHQFVSKAGDEEPNWPILPPVPSALTESLVSEQDFNQQTALNVFNSKNTDTQTGSAIEPNNLSELNPANAMEHGPATDPLSGANELLDQQLQLLDEAQYRAERTVTLRQHRRMRSNELHYIDHPLFGILIRIDEYKEQAENLAQ